ncbi:ABC transporter permease [Chloroflexota bacterium]
MANIWTIAKREYKLYFVSPAAYVVAFVILIVVGIFFYLNLSIASDPQQAGGYVPGGDVTLYPLATMLVLVIPAITTRLISDEQRMGTIELLLTAPVRDSELVIGKWLGGLLLILTIVAVTLVYPLVLNQYVEPGIDQGPLVSGYLGIALMCASLVAIGVFVSSLFSNQVASFVVTLGVMIFMWWVLGPIAQVLGPAASGSQIVGYLDFQAHFFDNLVRGVIDLADVVYFVSLTTLALFLSSVVVETRRWR